MANICMNHRGARPDGYVRELDDVRNPVRCNSYFGVGGHRKVGKR